MVYVCFVCYLLFDVWLDRFCVFLLCFWILYFVSVGGVVLVWLVACVRGLGRGLAVCSFFGFAVCDFAV